jgi:replicative DNA helicase
LVSWKDAAVTKVGLEKSVEIVKRRSLSRRYELFLKQQLAAIGDDEPLDAIQTTISALSELEADEQASRRQKSVRAVEVVEKYIEKAERVRDGEEAARIKTGIKAIDETTNGYRRGTLNIIAARPKVGKSALALNVAINMATDGTPVYLLSYEMFEDDIGSRLISTVAGIDTFHCEKHDYNGNSLERFAEARRELAALNLYFELEPRLTILDIPRRVRHEHRVNGCNVVIIDYLQLIPGVGKSSKNEEIEEITRQLKLLSTELGIVTIALSQLNRRGEYRDDKTPQLSDLRDSGAIEQDADTVIFLNECNPGGEKQEMLRMQLDEMPLKLTVAAHRSGPTGVHGLIFNKALQRFRGHHE